MKLPHQFSVRTDLAIESREMLHTKDGQEIPGVSITNEKSEENEIYTSWVRVLNEEGQKAMDKPMGNYITIESPRLKDNDLVVHEEVTKILAEKLITLKQLSQDATILIIGLGNWNVTPDALGPKVISKILVTRHLAESLPQCIDDDELRLVSAVSPGVMGQTGIETYEIVQGIVDRIKPDLLIAIDALAARSVTRINTTIQLSDTGINPGAGIGNKRRTLSEETLGVPVIAIGVPTVIDAATLVNDTMERILDEMIQYAKKEDSGFYTTLKGLDNNEKYQLILDILNPYSGNMFVTPKEVDAVVERLSHVIADSINIALHPGIGIQDIHRFTH